MLSRDAVVRRLAVIRHLFELGVQQSGSRFPAVAVLCFHDALEVLLQLGLEHHQAEYKDKADFLQLFDALKLKVTTLENRDALVRVNDVRKIVKHKTIEIETEEVERCLGRTRVFLEQTCVTLFAIDLFTMAMSDRIADEKIRESVKVAEIALEAGDLKKCVESAATAFSDMNSKYKIVSHVSTPHNIDRLAKGVIDAFTQLETKVNLMEMGVDHRRLLQFRRFVPSVQTSVNGQHTIVYFQTLPPSRERCEFCINFVVDVATAMEQHNRLIEK